MKMISGNSLEVKM